MIDVSNTMQCFWQRQGFATGLGWVWILANLTIAMATASVAWTFYGLHRRGGMGLPVSRWLIALLMALAAVCTLSHLGAMVGPPPIGRLGQTAVRAFTAVGWAAAAIRLPALRARLTAPLTIHNVPPANEHILKELAGRLRTTVRTLETIVHSEPCLLNRTAAVRQLRETLTEWEAQPCKS